MAFAERIAEAVESCGCAGGGLKNVSDRCVGDRLIIGAFGLNYWRCGDFWAFYFQPNHIIVTESELAIWVNRIGEAFFCKACSRLRPDSSDVVGGKIHASRSGSEDPVFTRCGDVAWEADARDGFWFDFPNVGVLTRDDRDAVIGRDFVVCRIVDRNDGRTGDWWVEREFFLGVVGRVVNDEHYFVALSGDDFANDVLDANFAVGVEKMDAGGKWVFLAGRECRLLEGIDAILREFVAGNTARDVVREEAAEFVTFEFEVELGRRVGGLRRYFFGAS